ncbi:MAG: SipW-dependent-type signal peptide-containing protein [Clostridiales bacterium]|nr:SipW-dependent-type signal peptide-containing protein [Clostridiales bacterium]
MNSSKKKFGLSVLSLLMCVAMLIGTTFAWFSDRVTSGNNRIVAGNLDMQLFWTDDYENGSWHNVEESGNEAIFGGDLWEPGYTQLRYIKIVNNGDLAFKYRLGVKAVGAVGELAEAIDVYCVDNISANIDARSQLSAYPNMGPLNAVLENAASIEASGVVLPSGATPSFGASQGEKTLAVALKMREEAGNEYKQKSIGDGFVISATASQVNYENDAFDNLYDSFPAMSIGDSVTRLVSKDASGRTVSETVLENGTDIKAVVPAGVLMDNSASSLTLKVKNVSEDNATIGGSMTRILDVHIDGISPENNVPVIVTIKNALPRSLNVGAVALTHKENGVQNPMTYKADVSSLSSHNDYTFDQDGTAYLALCSFSNITFEVDGSNPWDGTADTSWYSSSATSFTLTNIEDLAGLAQLVNNGNDFSGKTVTLGGEYNTWYINRESSSAYNEFTPIGTGTALTSELSGVNYRPFRGTFDGAGHIIAGLYHNYTGTASEKNSVVSLFGSVENATIKNITIAGSYVVSYGACVALVAGYAAGTCTFSDIILKDNTISTYNNYLGGIVGCVYDYSSKNANVTFKNIVIDSSNLYQALWNNFDLPCGGILGSVYPDSTVKFETCDISCQMSLYNDCCSSYSTSSYRYSGMLIGFVHGDSSTVNSFVNNKVTCTNVTVKYGEWTDLYYCELISLGRGSYTDSHQWKYQRIDKSQVSFSSSGAVTGCTAHNHSANNSAPGRTAEDEDHIAVKLSFNQLFGAAQGVSSITSKTGVTVINNSGSFRLAFPNTDSFLYRAGNMNTIALSSLFTAVGGTDIRSSAITLIAKQLQGNVKTVYTPNASNWSNGTVKFTGTGVVQLQLSYYDNTVLALNLEVVNAKNSTTAVSATANDVVMLNDASLSTITVSNGHTLHGNGFTLTASSDIGCSGLHSDCGYVTLSNGNLDNVKIVCPVFDTQILFQSQAEKDSNNKYIKVRNVVDCSGNSKIMNSYLSGGRTNIHTGGSSNTLTVSNTTLSGGTLANTDFYAGKKIIFNNVTTQMSVQTCTFDSSKQVFGFGILVESDTIKIELQGYLHQFNWITKAEASSYGDSNVSTFINKAFSYSQFVHSYNSQSYINPGILYICNWDMHNAANNMPEYLTDNRSDKGGYTGQDVTVSSYSGGVYSVGSSVTLTSSLYNAPAYVSNNYDVISPIFTYDNSVNNIPKTSTTEPYCTYSNGVISVGTKDSTKVIDFSGVSIVKDGEQLNPVMTVSSNSATVSGKKVTFPTNVTSYTVNFSVTIPSAGYNPDGTTKTGSTVFSWDINIEIAVLAYDPPVWNNVSTTGSNHIWVVKNPGTTDPDYSEAIPVYNGIKVKYYDKNGTLKTYDFTSLTTVPDIASDNASSSVTLSDGSVLKMTCTHGGYAYQLCSNVVYIYKTTARNNRDTTNYSITYTFKDPNGLSTQSTVKVTYAFSDSAPTIGVKQTDFVNGTYTTTSLEASCVVKGTMVTMADGSKKPVENIKQGDMLLVWDFDRGEFSASPVVFNDAEEENNYEVITLTFSDGTQVGVVSEHGFFDATLGKYVYLDENAANYIGHEFIKAQGNKQVKVKLTDVKISDQVISVYSPVTFSSLCLYTNDMLSMPGGISGLFNIYDVDVDTMKYDAAAKKADIEKYGLFTLSDYNGLIPEEAFEAFNGADLKVAIGKGILSFSDIEKYAARYIPLM